MAVPRVAGVGDLAGGDLQRGEQGGGAVPDVVVGLPSPAGPGRIGRIGAVRSSAWIWDFSSIESTTALSGGFRYSPTTSRTLASSCGSVENLNVSRPPRLQAPLPPDLGDPHVARCPAARPAAGSTSASPPAAPAAAPASPAPPRPRRSCAGRPGFGRSSSPAIPSAAYRFFHAITVGLDTPTRRTISSSPPHRRPATRSAPAAPTPPASTATASTTPAPHDPAAAPPQPQSTASTMLPRGKVTSFTRH